MSLEVQAATREDTVRITGKKRDDQYARYQSRPLQQAIAELERAELGVELQFRELSSRSARQPGFICFGVSRTDKQQD
ncbi:MAG: DUF520 family protein [Deltaproteobacteria bacterium]